MLSLIFDFRTFKPAGAAEKGEERYAGNNQ
jgi:hypothetical protein